ncbi:hypothetical protein D9M68_847080 [compost metagenome]
MGEPGALLPRGGVSQRDGVPTVDSIGLPRRNPGSQCWVACLERRVATAVVAVQVGVQQQIQCGAPKGLAHEGHGLLGMAAISGVDQCTRPVALEQDVVCRQPAPLEDGDTRSSEHFGNDRRTHVQAVASIQFTARRARRRILPTFVLGNSSRNSMYLGRL